VSDLVVRLERLEAAKVADAQGGLGIMDPGIQTIVPGVKAAGTAFTVKCYPGSIITVHRALVRAKPGDVLVVDGEGDGRAGALMGELMAREAIDRGLRGIVCDGALRDAAGLRELGFPSFARYVTPRVGVNRRLGLTEVDVTVGGVIVRMGDFILADDDGVAVIPREQIAEIIEKVEAINVKEQGFADAIDRHERLVDILGFGELIGVK
jgi:4-hydroxy-4-methyl-2-oxoglutarate aldolase